MNILLILPPLTQINTPYPSTTVLKGFLQTKGHTVFQCDLGIKLINKVYSKAFLTHLFSDIPKTKDAKLLRIYNEREAYINSVDSIVNFLQGNDQNLATRIVNRTLLPEGPRFDELADLEWAFGTAGIYDKARHLATLYMEDLADYIRKTKAKEFDLIRYAEQIAMSAPNFDSIQTALTKPLSIIDELMLNLFEKQIKISNPRLIGFSIPFPGCLYAALRCAQLIKNKYPYIKTVIGGGYPNTELRRIKDKRIFNYIDFITLDDGEIPTQRLCNFIEGKCNEDNLVRCFYIKDDKLQYSGNDDINIPFSETGTPDFSGLDLSKYISLIELTNPMHKLWTDGKWNKMIMAHGCYWAKCAFCDCSLDYIKRYDAPPAKIVVDRMESIMKQTGQSGFHFTDEALPPKLLKEVAREIIRRNLTVSFWGNIRFEKSFTEDLCLLLSDAGCIAVSGGLEVASNRLLKLMNKGVSLEQAAQSAHNFTSAGIMVHCYLMYGFPTETTQETIDSLEIVRQLFNEGLIQSAFWHRLTMTVHSPIGENPDKFKAIKTTQDHDYKFALNGVEFTDQQDIDFEMLGEGLHLATYNYMHGIGLDTPTHKWFKKQLSKTTINKKFIKNIIKK